MSPKNQKRTDRLASILLSLTVILGLLAFVPNAFIAGSSLKGFILVVGSMLSFMVWLVGRLAEGSFRIPRSSILAALGIFVGVAFISAVFSHAPYLSFFGENFDQGAFMSILSLGLVSFLASVLFDSRARLLGFLGGYFFAYLLLAAFQIAHLIAPGLTSFGAFPDRASTVLGSWADLAYLSGAVLVVFTLVVTFFKPARALRGMAIVTSIIALFFLVLVDSPVAFVVVGIASIAILIYALLLSRLSEHKRFPAMAFAVSLVMLFLILTNGVFGGALARMLQASSVDGHPNLAATLIVARDSLAKHSVVGAGPNQFLHEWVAYHPFTFNLSSYWDTSFGAGASYLMTVAFLGGLLGVVAVLGFLAVFLFDGGRRVFRTVPEREGSRLVFSAFILAAYFVAILLAAVPGVGITVSAFFFVGLFVAALAAEKRVKVCAVAFMREYRRGFLTLLLLMLSAVAVTFAVKRFVSLAYFEKGVNAAELGDFARGDMRFSEAIGIADLPGYERARTVLAEQELAALFAANPATAPVSDAAKAQIQSVIAVGTTAAERAVEIDPANVANYVALGDYLSLLAPFGVQSAAETAEAAYKQAIVLAPNYPKSYLDLATLYFSGGDSADARTYASRALSVKANYTEAFLLLARIDSSTGDLASAKTDLQSAVKADTTDADALTALGEFDYGSGDFADAVTTLRAAVIRSTDSVEAWYYLALADAKAGNKDEAGQILTMLHAKFPTDTDVSSALVGLSAPLVPVPAPAPKAKAKK